MQHSEISAFYDEFMDSRMIDYRIHGSRRLELAIGLIRPLIETDSVVLDVGCGIGIITEELGRIARHGRVVGVDISNRNIWYAKQTIDRPNVSFMVADILADIDRVRVELGELADAIVMVDTIEHIQENDRAELLKRLAPLCAPKAILAVTFPSPAYQRYLVEHDPTGLQIIDNIIEPEELFAEAKSAGFFPVYYSLADCGRTNQYAHCIFGRQVDTREVAWRFRGMLKRIPKKVGRFLTYPLRVHRYKRRIFTGETDEDQALG